MKRLIFCFDGTWNALNADTPTNVVLTAASIFRMAPDGTAQVIHYDEGVGTGRLERNSGGMFGAGLVANIREAYRFLIFNYDPGDEIFVFGFSRGAWSARTFVGFIRHVGPLRRLHAARIDEALALYRNRLNGEDGASESLRRFRASYSDGVCIGDEDDAWRCSNMEGYAAGSAPPVTIKYLGVWDTVSALGVPKGIPLSGMLNRKHRFHDADLTGFVESARHAVAIDEGRALFPPEPWGDLTELNLAKGFAASDPDAPYQERWFPGTHGSVGGGGDIRGLSDGALAWVLKGAKDAGLRLDIDKGSRIQAFAPDPLAPLVNEKSPSGGPTHWVKKGRQGPTQIWQISAHAIRRWHAPANALPERKLYRPGALAALSTALDGLPVSKPIQNAEITHTVVERDNLSKIARRYLGDAELWPVIYEANRDTLDDPDEVYLGQVLRIPARPDTGEYGSQDAGKSA